MSSSPKPISVTFLGSGTSSGVPMIGCSCAVCASQDPRDKRTRPSILVRLPQEQTPSFNILVDTTPEMRIQMLRTSTGRVNTVLMTHSHADHLMGMDDIRQFNFRQEMAMPIYGAAGTLADVRRVFDYCFKETQMGGGKPQLLLEEITPYQTFGVNGFPVTPLTVLHGRLPVIAYKFGDSFAYVTDVSEIPEETFEALKGLDTLILGTVRYDPHPTHLGLWQALEVIEKLAPRQAYLTHLSHHFTHHQLLSELPANVAPGYDGLTFSVSEREQAP